MIPPYDITPEILKRITSISEKIGEINANYLAYPSPQLRRENKIKTIHSSLKIEGNNLTEEQVTALLSVRPYSRVSRLEASLARLSSG